MPFPFLFTNNLYWRVYMTLFIMVLFNYSIFFLAANIFVYAQDKNVNPESVTSG